MAIAPFELEIPLRVLDKQATDALQRVEKIGIQVEARMNKATEDALAGAAKAMTDASAKMAQATEQALARTNRAQQQAADAQRKVIAVADQQSRALGPRFAQAGLAISMAAEQMARSGNVMGEGLRQVLVQGGQMVALFGIGGPIVSAVAVAGLAIVNIFLNARKEMEATRKAALEELNKMQEGSDVAGLEKRAQRIVQGDPIRGTPGLRDLEANRALLSLEFEFAKKRMTLFEAGRLGRELTALDARIAGMRAQLADLMRRAQGVPGESGARGLMGVAVRIGASRGDGTAGAAPAVSAPSGAGTVGSIFGDRTPPNLADRLPIFNIAAGEIPSFKAAREQIEKDAAKLQDTIQSSVAQGVGGAIMSAFSAAFDGEGIGGIIAAFGKSVLQSMMGMFANAIAQMAAKLEIWGKIASAFSKAFAALGPWAGPAAIAAAVAMMALAHSMGGGTAGGAQPGGRFGAGALPGYGGGAAVRYTVPSAPAPASVGMASAERAPSVTLNMVNVGWSEPQVQRGIFLAYEGARQQGMGAAAMGSYRRQSGV